jgi:hypothetical protein
VIDTTLPDYSIKMPMGNIYSYDILYAETLRF